MEKLLKRKIIITDITLACYVLKGQGSSIHENRANYGIMINCGEEVDYEFKGGKRISVSKGDMLFFPKGSSYVIRSRKGDCYAINFELSNIGEVEPFLFKPKNKTDFLDNFKAAELAWRQKNTGYEMKCMSLLYKILYSVRKELEYSYIDKKGRDKLLPAIEFIHKNYTSDKISISHLAEMCGISESYFRRNFQKAFALSPVKYINRLRFIRAKELIKTGMYSVLEVSLMSGFTSEAYFSREFKKAVGVNPSEYKGLNG